MTTRNTDDGKVSYATYMVAELHEALAAIDREKYPVNFANLTREIAARPQADLADPSSRDGKPARTSPRAPPSVATLAGRLGFVALLLVFGVHGLAKDDVYLPTRAGGQHLHGNEAIGFVVFFAVAMIANGAMLFSRMKSPSTDAPWYRFGKNLGMVALVAVIAWALHSIVT